MKNLLLSVFVFLSFSFLASVSFSEIINAIKSGNASEISKFFDNTVEITFPGKSNSYSKSQAELVLRDFFSKNPAKNFKIIHKSDNEGSQYCIGNLETINGTFRTTIYLRQKGENQVIQELRFEK
ncbi:MAG: DUF4783 domain-containing protein [Ginsengibacter sp.]